MDINRKRMLTLSLAFPRYWIFISLFSTFDMAIGFIVPFGSLMKFMLISQLALPQQSSLVDIFYDHICTPIYSAMDRNGTVQRVNAYIVGLSSGGRSRMMSLMDVIDDDNGQVAQRNH